MIALLLTVLAGNDRVMSPEEVHAALPLSMRPPTLGATMGQLDMMCTMGLATHESLPPAPGTRFPRVAYRVRRPGRA